MRVIDINQQTVDRIFSSASKVYEGADSYVCRAGDYCIHRYKDHVDFDLFGLYRAATEQSINILNSTYVLESLSVPIIVEVVPILASFLSKESKVCSVTEWVDWQRGDLLKRDHNYSQIVIAATELANSYLRYPNTQIMGIEVTPQNTRYKISSENVRCKITDVGNSLRYLYTASHW